MHNQVTWRDEPTNMTTHVTWTSCQERHRQYKWWKMEAKLSNMKKNRCIHSRHNLYIKHLYYSTILLKNILTPSSSSNLLAITPNDSAWNSCCLLMTLNHHSLPFGQPEPLVLDHHYPFLTVNTHRSSSTIAWWAVDSHQPCWLTTI